MKVLSLINSILFFALPLLACIAIYNSLSNKYWAAFIVTLVALSFLLLIEWGLRNRKKDGGAK